MRNEQETFWESDFGDEYSKRNNIEENYDKRVYEFQKYIFKVDSINSVLEIGANVGTNLKVLKSLYPKLELHAVEINKQASQILSDKKICSVSNCTINDYEPNKKYELSLVKGVLIHLNPEELPLAYKKYLKVLRNIFL